MSEHMFGGRQRTRLTRAQVAKLHAIAERHGATFSYINNAQNPHLSWFCCPNRGAPFDGATARAVAADVARELPELSAEERS